VRSDAPKGLVSVRRARIDRSIPPAQHSNTEVGRATNKAVGLQLSQMYYRTGQ
jgi:hypothetical protein